MEYYVVINVDEFGAKSSSFKLVVIRFVLKILSLILIYIVW
jgi:hypothetical protein